MTSLIRIGSLAAFAVLASVSLALAQSPSPREEAAAAAADLAPAVNDVLVNHDESILPDYDGEDPDPALQNGVMEDAAAEALAADDRAGEAGREVVEGYANRTRTPLEVESDEFAPAREVAGKSDAQLIAENFAFITAEGASACTTTHGDGTPLITRYCDEYADPESSLCNISWEVEVDAIRDYACDRETPSFFESCTETLRLSCDQIETCDETGVTFLDLNQTVVLDADPLYPHLQTAPRGRTSCARYTSSFNMFVANVDHLAVARITEVYQDDWIQVAVNGERVLTRPLGTNGAPLEIVRIYTEGRGGPELSGHDIHQSGARLGVCNFSGQVAPASIDLTDHLVDGNNTVTITNIIGNVGGWHLKFELIGFCCRAFRQTWESACLFE